MTTSTHTEVAIVGGGAAGITVAARLRRAGVHDITIVDPADIHYYQPLWTLVGGGVSKLGSTGRTMASVIPRDVRWVRDAVVDVDADGSQLSLASGSTLHYRWLVMAPGIQLDWDGVDGLADAIGSDGVTSNYRADLAPYTWDLVRRTTSGTAVFTMPSGPIKCAGAPQKAAYLSADWWRRQGVLDAMDIHLVLPTPGMFGIKAFADTLEEVANRYGITVHLSSQLVGIDGERRQAAIRDDTTGAITTLDYDIAHVVPPQSAPNWVKSTTLADPASPQGYIEVDRHTLGHTRYSNVFALGDAGNTPNSKTGAAIRKQAPVVVANLLAARDGVAPTKSYNGYASCPLVTARGKCVIAEFDYDLKPTPSFPIIDMTAERSDMYLLKKHGLPMLYWHGMLTGRA
jgi:sulfide:quinone oxidoreductase